MRKISVLDCTLRDGGYVNNWNFSDEQISIVLKHLIRSNVEIIECGYLSQTRGMDSDSTLFKSFDSLNNIIGRLEPSSQSFVLMMNMDEYDVDNLPEYEGGYVSGIRLAFHKDRQIEALEIGKKIVAKGYELYIQPMVISDYSYYEILELITEFESVNYKAIYVVDSLGVMRKNKLREIFEIFDNNVPEGKILGFHAHGDLGRTLENSAGFIDKVFDRDIIVDASINGMGRGEGNLPTKAILNHLNENNAETYKIRDIEL